MGWNEKMNWFKYSFLNAVDFPGSVKVNVWVFDRHDDTQVSTLFLMPQN